MAIFQYKIALLANIKVITIMYIMTQTISVTIPTGLREKIDSLRGDVSRSRFISRALETVFYQAEVKK